VGRSRRIKTWSIGKDSHALWGSSKSDYKKHNVTHDPADDGLESE